MKTSTLGQICSAIFVVGLITLSAATADAQHTLLGFTGNGATNSTALFTIDTTNASSTLLFDLAQGNGGGAAIGFNTDDGLLYRASGNDAGKLFESIDLMTGDVTNIPITGPTATMDEYNALVYNGGGVFLSSQRGPNNLRSITTGGAEVQLGPLNETNKGLAFLGTGELVATSNNNMFLEEISAVDGSTINIALVSSSIVGATGFAGMARNPDDDTIWAVVRIGSDFDRRLVRLDNINLGAGTADATEFGDLGDRFAALEFVPTAALGGGLVTVTPDTVTPTRGQYVAGDAASLAESDNVDYQMRRAIADTQSRTEFEVKSTSPNATPTTFEFTLEGAVFARSNVVQTIELFDYVAGDWELVDSSDAVRSPNPDSVVTVAATGDLSRFVEAGTMCIEARIHFQSDSPRQQFASNTDQTVWTIE